MQKNVAFGNLLIINNISKFNRVLIFTFLKEQKVESKLVYTDITNIILI